MNNPAVVDVFLGHPLVDRTEKQFLERLRRDLLSRGISARILANLQVGVRNPRQLDFLLITDQRVVMCELKGYRHQLIGRANGRWSCLVDGKELELDGNPFRQAHDTTYALSDSLERFARNADVPGPRRRKYYADIDTCISLFPEIPGGSTFERYLHVTVLGYQDLLDRLAKPGPCLQWSERHWDAFIRHLGLYREEEDSDEARERRVSSAAVEEYVGHFLQARGQLPPLVETSVIVNGQATERPDLAQELAAGHSLLLRGESGMGKTFWAQHAAVAAAQAGMVPVWLSAVSTEETFKTSLALAVAPFSTLTARQLLAAAEASGRGVIFFVDGLNEAPEAVRETLMEGVHALRLRTPSSGLLITAQSAEQVSDLREATDVQLLLPESDERRAVLSAYGAEHLVERSAAFNTPYELSLAAACADSLPQEASTTKLLDLYVARATGTERIREGLRALAAHMHGDVRLSLTISEASRLLRRDLTYDADRVEELLTNELVKAAQGRVTFRHERLAHFLVAEDLLLCTQDAQQFAARLNKPLSRPLREDAIALEADRQRLSAALAAITDAGVLQRAALGMLGAKARDVALGVITDALALAAARTTGEAIGFVAGSGLGIDGRWTIPWQDEPAYAAALSAAGGCLAAGMFIEEIGRLIDQTDALCQAQKQAGIDFGESFAAAYVFSRPGEAGTLPANILLRSVEAVRFSAGFDHARAHAAARELVCRSDTPGSGTLYVAMCLLRWPEPEAADLVASIATNALGSRSYHVRLEALHLAAAAARLLEGESRERVLARVRANLGDNPIFNSAVIEALAAFGDIEPGRTLEDVLHEIRYVLDRPDEERSWKLASGVVSSQFEDESVVGPYFQAISELTANDRQRLLALAVRGGQLDDIHIAWAVSELDDPDEPLVAAAMESKIASANPAAWFSIQTGVNTVNGVLALLAKVNAPLPTLPPGIDPAWEVFMSLMWSTMCIHAGHDRREAQSRAWNELTEQHREVLADLLANIHSARSIASQRTPDIYALLTADIPAAAIAALAWSVQHPGHLRTPFRFSPAENRMRRTVELLGHVGGEADADVLRGFVNDPSVGETAVSAVQAIESRT